MREPINFKCLLYHLVKNTRFGFQTTHQLYLTLHENKMTIFDHPESGWMPVLANR